MLFSPMLSGVLFARDRDAPIAPDEQACADLAGAKKAPWSVTSAEFVRPPFTVGSGKSAVGRTLMDRDFAGFSRLISLQQK